MPDKIVGAPAEIATAPTNVRSRHYTATSVEQYK
jgi:hypothetical protein